MQSSFFAPQDTEGLIGLYKSKAEFERQLDQLFVRRHKPARVAVNERFIQ